LNSIYYHCFKNKDYWFQQVWVHVLCKSLQDKTRHVFKCIWFF